MQVDSIKTRVDSVYGVCNQHLKLSYDDTLSDFGFIFNLRHYFTEVQCVGLSTWDDYACYRNIEVLPAVEPQVLVDLAVAAAGDAAVAGGASAAAPAGSSPCSVGFNPSSWAVGPVSAEVEAETEAAGWAAVAAAAETAAGGAAWRGPHEAADFVVAVPATDEEVMAVYDMDIDGVMLSGDRSGGRGDSVNIESSPPPSFTPLLLVLRFLLHLLLLRRCIPSFSACLYEHSPRVVHPESCSDLGSSACSPRKAVTDAPVRCGP